MLRDVRLERFECSPALVERYVNHEFDRMDIDSSGYIEMTEFTKYVTTMTAWMRTELMARRTDSTTVVEAVPWLVPVAALTICRICVRLLAGTIQRERALRNGCHTRCGGHLRPSAAAER
jgi:hypothetical protein